MARGIKKKLDKSIEFSDLPGLVLTIVVAGPLNSLDLIFVLSLTTDQNSLEDPVDKVLVISSLEIIFP